MKFFEQLDVLRATKRIRFTHLETELSSETDELNSSEMSPSHEEIAVRRFVEDLVFIEDALNVIMPYPDEIDDFLLDQAEWIAKALRYGSVKVNPPDFLPENAVLMAKCSPETAREMINDFYALGSLQLTMPDPTTDLKVNLLGQNIHLGPTRFSFANLQFTEINNLETEISKLDTQDISVTVILDIDPNEVYIKLKDWPRE